MKFTTANTDSLVKARNLLLQKSMRPSNLPFDLPAEYPIVLSPHDPQYSHCVLNDDQLIAHANLWPRKITTTEGTQLTVGLVGNVATAESWRGKGVMRQLFQHLEKIAKTQKLDALVLWSDLSKFYQKLGYKSVGQEFRFTFSSASLRKIFPNQSGQFFPISIHEIDTQLTKKLLSLRYKTNSVDRSPEEFTRLLRIPATALFCSESNSDIDGYAILGKGYDMMGVVHEWGTSSPQNLLQALNDICFQLNIESTMLLSPKALGKDWQEYLATHADLVEEHPMALAHLTDPDLQKEQLLSSSFIWGLDSI